MSRCFSKSTAWAWMLRQAKSRNLSNNQSCVNPGWCWSISVRFPTLWFLPVTVYLDMIHWLSTLPQEKGWRRKDREIIQELSLLHVSSLIHSLNLPLSFCFRTKAKLNWRPLHRRKTLFWTTHGVAHFKNTFQNCLKLHEFTWLLLRRPESIPATLLQRLLSVRRDKHADTLCHTHDCSVSGCHFWLAQNLPLTPALPGTRHAQLCPAQFNPAETLPPWFLYSQLCGK